MADCGRGGSRSALLVGTALTGALCAFVAASPAGAATTSWIDATGDWLNPANWSLGVPNFGLDATVSNGGTAQINGPATANTLTIGGNSAVDLQTGALTAGAVFLNPTGTLSVNGSTFLNVIGFIGVQGGTLRAATTDTITSHVEFAPVSSGTISAAAGQTFTLTFAAGGLAVFPSATVRIGSASDTGTVVFAPSFLPTVVAPGTNTYEVVAGTWRAGTPFGIGPLTASGLTTIVDSGATLDMNGFATPIRRLQGSGTVATGGGTLTLTPGAGPVPDFGGAITGSGAVVVAGNQIFTGTNTYTGGTTISGGILQLGNGGTSGSIIGDVVDNAGLRVARSDTYTFAGNISGAGSFVQAGPGTTILTGTNTYGGGTIILVGGGTLQIGNGGTAGSITGDVFNDANLAFNHSDNITFGGVISGTGAVQQNGTGRLTLSGINTYLGGTSINAGTVAITADNNLGAATGPISFNGGTLHVDTAGASVTLSATRAMTLNAGGGTIDVTGTDGVNYAGSIGGVGGLAISGNQGVFLSGNNTYGGPTTIIGALSVSGGNAIPDASAVAVNTGGTLIFSGAETIGSLAGGGQAHGGIVGVNTLTTGANNTSTTFSGTLVDVGLAQTALTKIGSGTQTLSGINTYTGPTTVNGGTLSVNGSIATSSVTVNNGGTLGGTGTVGPTTVNSGGTLSPGNSIGTVTVNGNLVFGAGSTYRVEVAGAASDRTNATGTATLTGGTVQVVPTGTSFVRSYTILSAAGGLGGTTFSGLSGSLPNFTASLGYTSTDVLLNLTGVLGTGTGLNSNQQNVAGAINTAFNAGGALPNGFGSVFGLSGAPLANALTQLSGETATGSQQTTFDAMGMFLGVMTDPFITGRGDATSAGGSPNAYADEQALSYSANGKPRSNSERDAYAAMARKAPVMADPFAQRWTVWAAGYGGSQTTDGNAALGSNNTTSRIAGGVVGADYRFSPFTLAGFALAGGGTNFSIANGLGSGRSDLFQAGAFVRHTVGPAYISAALAYGWQDITTDRTVTIAGVDQLRAKFNANAFSGRVEGGYRFVSPYMGGIGITPYAAGQFTTFDLPAYAEQAVVGANTFALAYGAKSVTASRSELGLRSDKSFGMQDGIFTLRGRVAWAHDFNPDRSIAATFQTLPGASFVVNGAAQAHDAALTTASAEMKWLSGFSLAATFEGEFSNVTRSYAGKGVARYQW